MVHLECSISATIIQKVLVQSSQENVFKIHRKLVE